MKSVPAAVLAAVAAAALSGCGSFQSQAPATPSPLAPVVNAPAPPLPPDPALGPHGRPEPEQPQRGRRQPEPARSTW